MVLEMTCPWNTRMKQHGIFRDLDGLRVIKHRMPAVKNAVDACLQVLDGPDEDEQTPSQKAASALPKITFLYKLQEGIADRSFGCAGAEPFLVISEPCQFLYLCQPLLLAL